MPPMTVASLSLSLSLLVLLLASSGSLTVIDAAGLRWSPGGIGPIDAAEVAEDQAESVVDVQKEQEVHIKYYFIYVIFLI